MPSASSPTRSTPGGRPSTTSARPTWTRQSWNHAKAAAGTSRASTAASATGAGCWPGSHRTGWSSPGRSTASGSTTPIPSTPARSRSGSPPTDPNRPPSSWNTGSWTGSSTARRSATRSSAVAAGPPCWNCSPRRQPTRSDPVGPAPARFHQPLAGLEPASGDQQTTWRSRVFSSIAISGFSGVPPEFGDGPGEGVLDQDPLSVGRWLVAQVVEGTDNGDHVGPRVVGRTGQALPDGGEAVGDLQAVLEEVAAAVADVDAGRADARRGPVDHAGHAAAAPEHVARVEVAVDEHGRTGAVGSGLVEPLDRPGPDRRPAGPPWRLVRLLPVGCERADQARRWQRAAVDGGQQPGQTLEPPVRVGRCPVDTTREA